MGSFGIRILVASVAVAAASAAALAVDTVTVTAAAGRTYAGTIDASGDAHAYLLDGFSPEGFTVSVKAARESLLVPDLFLEDPDGEDVTDYIAPYRKDGARTIHVKSASFPPRIGRFVLRIAGKSATTGGYLLKFAPNSPMVYDGQAVSVGGAGYLTVFLPEEAVVTVIVVPDVYPTLLSPDGLDMDPLPEDVPAPAGGFALRFRVTRGGYHAMLLYAASGTVIDVRLRVKPARAPKTLVIVDAGAPISTRDPGPGGAKAVRRTARRVAGFEAGFDVLCWREVERGGPGVGENSIWSSALSGARARVRDAAFAVDPDSRARDFSLYLNTWVLAVADDALESIPLVAEFGDPMQVNDSVGSLIRLVDSSAVRSGGMTFYPVDEVSPGIDTPGLPPGTIHEACRGFENKILAVESPGGDLDVIPIDVSNVPEVSLGTLSPAPPVLALAARGPDVFLATGGGADPFEIRRFTRWGVEPPVVLAETEGPVSALAADEFCVYAIEDHPVEGVRIVQFPQGGGRGTVMARSSTEDDSFVIDPDDLAAGSGAVYYLAHRGDRDVIYRQKVK